ncbi:Tim10/DDP family zinc finger-domain-containing protein [Xylariaceae sp. FL0594]|nr:Tim10/DDP family zinc finger-domain-containing protein [Xylariaceae sp. FL0594]
MDSAQVKAEVMRQVQTQYAIDNAKQLIERINDHCFQRCIPKPGASLSSGEQTCFTQCMEKYMAAWNHVNGAAIEQLRHEAQSS